MKKPIVIFCICGIGIAILSIQTQAQSENTAILSIQAQSDNPVLPKKSVKELKQFSEENNDWRVTYRKNSACLDHAGETLNDGQIVNFCQQQQTECGSIHLHHSFRVQGNLLEFRSLRVSEEHGKIIKRYNPMNLDDASKERLAGLKEKLGKY